MNVRDAARLQETVKCVMETMVGLPIMKEESQAPCAATMSRSTAKLDLAHCLLRQLQWEKRRSDGIDYGIQLSYYVEFI